MPISKETENPWFGIQETCQRLRWECTRADILRTPGPVVDQIYSQIRAADVVIGEMTGGNPNVFYEIGIAHALGKTTVLLAASKEDLTAFDLNHIRHHFHDGLLRNLRGILEEVLANIEIGGHPEYEPTLPNGEVLYGWPSQEFDAPRLRWKSRTDPDHQLDLDGGQSIQNLSGVGSVVTLTNTDRNWNHHLKSSIMWLGPRTHALHPGDKVYLLIAGKASSEARFEFGGDGGWLDPNIQDKWTSPWKGKVLQVESTPVWTMWVTETVVEPTQPGYDPSKRGTSMWLMSSVGTGTAQFKKIKVVRVPAVAGGA
jgi:hypothetical protein